MIIKLGDFNLDVYPNMTKSKRENERKIFACDM